MAEIPNTRIILELKKIFMEETDENHQLSMQDLIQKLQGSLEWNVAIDKKRIIRYINNLNDSGFEVIEETEKYGKKVYSHLSRLFETHELRILVDAVLSAKFLNEKETKSITDKLYQLTSQHLAKSLPSPIRYNNSKDFIELISKVYIDKIHRAILDRRAIKFKYGDFNFDRSFQYRRNGKEYIYYPYETIWDQGYYYLIGQKDNKEGLSNYRVDRMRDVEILEQRFKPIKYDISSYMRANFHMFSGEGEWVEIEFSDKKLLNPIFDKYGLNAEVHIVDENTFILKTMVIKNEGFLSWLRGWGSKAKILSPPELVLEMKEEVRKMNNLYS